MSTSTINLATSHDFVVIGGGTSGLTVANRLSENSEVQVLVLEAGGIHLADPRVIVPALCMQATGSELDWQFMTEPQEQLKNRKIRQPQGRLLGGSSGINNQAFISPSPTGIDAWAKLGNNGWTWATMEPYYRKFYTLNVPDDATSRHLGLDYITDTDKEARGPVQVSYTGVVQGPLSKAWVDTFKGLNHGITVHFRVYLWEDMPTLPLWIIRLRHEAIQLRRAQAEKIEFAEGDGDKVAKAVNFSHEGKSYTVEVRKVVVLAAGTFQSPKIMELSGIGNSEILMALDIPVVVDNKNVGENLQDHLMTGISFEVSDGVMTGDSLMRQDPEAIAAATNMYQNHKAGPMTVGGIASHAFMPIAGSNPASDISADLETLLQQYPADPKHKLQISNPQASSVLVLVKRMSSRGTSHVVSKKVSDAPRIDPRYFSHPLDLELLARHVQSLERLARSPPLSNYIKPNGKRNHSTAYVDDLADAKEYARSTALSNYHPAGTCAMLPRHEGGVVNNRLIVYGTRNVRVVDASIMPLIPRSNLQSTVYAVAERAADLIKATS